VQGDSETAGFATNKGEVVAPFAAGVPVTTIAGSGSFNIKSEGAGFVKTREGGAEGNAASGVAGTSSGKIAESSLSGATRGDSIVNSSSAAKGKGSFIAGYSPDESANPTGGAGFGRGSAGVETSSAI
jgi:hypothetical protein